MTATAASSGTTATPPRLPGGALVTTLIWVALAVLAGVTGALTHLPFPIPQTLILALVVATIVVTHAAASVRAWIEALPLRTLVGIHALRFVGIVFLVLAARGQLAQLFASRAGWGDIAVAALALVLLASGEPRTTSHRAFYQLWNLLGAADLIVAVGTAAWVGSRGLEPGVEPLFAAPLSLVPLFFVPVFLAAHVFIFRRLREQGLTDGR